MQHRILLIMVFFIFPTTIITAQGVKAQKKPAIVLQGTKPPPSRTTRPQVQANSRQGVVLKGDILPKITFKRYKAKPIQDNFVARWFHTTGRPQEAYNVSLIAVNVNTWLENPSYFKVLLDVSKGLSLRDIMDNLAVNNPTLRLNIPRIVTKALNSDIYNPYLSHVKSIKPIKHQFATTKAVISYTRKYHIFGATIGDLPYFGRPVEGANRSINLGLIPGQIEETIAKLPDTDIFLVAMVNIIPNWLEETTDIFQVNQQELEIIIYAFNRDGKLIGGSGMPMTFKHEQQTFNIKQKVTSKIWQPSTSRSFYLLPSYRIANTPLPGVEVRTSSIVAPTDKWPVLNSRQKKILEAIKSLQKRKQDINVELFNEKGEFIFSDIVKDKTNPPGEIIDKVLQHRRSEIFNTTSPKPVLSQQSVKPLLQNKNATGKTDPQSRKVTVKSSKVPPKVSVKPVVVGKDQVTPEEPQAQESSGKRGARDRNWLSFRDQQSNEGSKILSLLRDGWDALRKPIWILPERSYTNILPKYQYEINPSTYNKEKKIYFSITKNLRRKEKEYRRESFELLKKSEMFTKDRVFWIEQELKHQNNEEAGKYFKEWKPLYERYRKAQIDLEQLLRKKNYFININTEFKAYTARNTLYLQLKYVKKKKELTKKIAQLYELTNKITLDHAKKSTSMEGAVAKLQETVSNLQVPMDVAFKAYKNSLGDFTLEDSGEFGQLSVTEIAENHGVDPRIIKAVLVKGVYPIGVQYELKVRELEKERLVKRYREQYYDGYMLGLSSNREVMSFLHKRLNNL